MSDWDILRLPEEEGWEHLQILDRLHSKGIECFFVDMWMNDVVFIIGCHPGGGNGARNVADALNVPIDIIYFDYEHSFVFINLYQLKAIRAGFAEDIERYSEEHGFD